jgi:hypothetical protein
MTYTCIGHENNAEIGPLGVVTERIGIMFVVTRKRYRNTSLDEHIERHTKEKKTS